MIEFRQASPVRHLMCHEFMKYCIKAESPRLVKFGLFQASPFRAGVSD
jgi:hypothetical protein